MKLKTTVTVGINFEHCFKNKKKNENGFFHTKLVYNAIVSNNVDRQYRRLPTQIWTTDYINVDRLHLAT